MTYNIAEVIKGAEMACVGTRTGTQVTLHDAGAAPIIIKPGVQIRVRGLRWSAGWEFDCPTAIIAPVYRFHEDGCSLEHAVESLLIDACIDGVLKSHDPHFWTEFRGWSPAYLRRQFYRKHVERTDLLVTFELDEDGELTWTEQPFSRRQPGGGAR